MREVLANRNWAGFNQSVEKDETWLKPLRNFCKFIGFQPNHNF